ncbi:hypothetical protein CDAR_222281 [Caerostris darwini]|uniref:Uncharacterized protein n=1 Tax=Caerostris darwini TaxID=1538125 RepID=A0AAV4W8H6_9ARAC|nr:hypothetical protein CDAR_222281 [Caerostris darwini]
MFSLPLHDLIACKQIFSFSSQSLILQEALNTIIAFVSNIIIFISCYINLPETSSDETSRSLSENFYTYRGRKKYEEGSNPPKQWEKRFFFFLFLVGKQMFRQTAERKPQGCSLFSGNFYIFLC